MKTIVLFILILVSFQIAAQKKEHEQRVDKDSVPEKALKFVEQIKIDMKHPRWYKENTSGKRSYEIKFVYDHQLHSVEFNEVGLIEDIEVMIKKRKLKPEVLRTINNSLDEIYDKYKIVKIQKQFSSEKEDDLIKILNQGISEDVVVKYEIEFEAKQNGSWKMYEGTFTKDGRLESKREIVIRSTENLNY